MAPKGAWRVAGCILAGLAGAGPAAASPEPGRSSSASVEISVSVAARHWLRPAGKPDHFSNDLMKAGHDRLCIAANRQAMPLPVMLAWSPPSDGSANALPAMETGVELSRCGESEEEAEAAFVPSQHAGPLIVRPE